MIAIVQISNGERARNAGDHKWKRSHRRASRAYDLPGIVPDLAALAAVRSRAEVDEIDAPISHDDIRAVRNDMIGLAQAQFKGVYPGFARAPARGGCWAAFRELSLAVAP